MLTRRRRCWHGILVAVLVLALAAPFPGWSAASSLGSARGIRGIDLSWDGGEGWLPLGGRSLPILEGTEIKSTTGGARLEFADGSQVNPAPFTRLAVREVRGTVEVSLLYGRVTFRLPARSRVVIRTPTARLEPGGTALATGELFVAADGTLGLQMAQGTLEVRDLRRPRPFLASLDPVFLPKRPEIPGPLFSTELPEKPPADAKGVYTPRGESIGYLTQPDPRFVVHPGFTADLTQPFPRKLVQLAMAKVPAEHRSDALPLFDVHGGYVGYVAGPTFYAQAQLTPGMQVAQVVEGAPPGILAGLAGPGAITTTIVFTSITLPIIAGGTDGFGTQDGPDLPAPPPDGTPLRPVRR